jgi:hypothetical protein
MGVAVGYTGARNYDTVKPIQFRYRKVTFDSSYPTGGEAIVAADFGLTTLHSVMVHGVAVKSDLTDSVAVAWNPTTGKLVAYRSGAISAPTFTGTPPAGVTVGVKDADGAAAAGVAVYVHVDEVLEQGTALAHLEFVSPTNADGTGTLSNGGPTYYIQDDDNAATAGVALYIDEDGTAGSRLIANTGRDCYVMCSNGDFIKVTANADPGTPGVAVYFDEDAVNTYERLLFVSPADTSATDTTSAAVSMRTRTPAGTVAGVSATPLAEVSSTSDLAAYSVYVTVVGT